MAVAPIPYEEISLGEIIGEGFYGTVFKGQWQEKTVAVKRIIVGRADKQIEREVYQLSRLQHDNIVRLYGISKYEDMFHLLVEYADGGSLSTLIHSKSLKYTLANAFNWAHQIAKGLAYLHAMKPKAVIHRDIKPNNAVLSHGGLSLKICDFGTVVELTTSMSVDVGTCLYKAPEVFHGRHYNEKCDVHSWAITFWEILARKQPFKKCKTSYAVIFAVKQGDRPSLSDIIMRDCPEDIVKLISACWDPEPSRRYSIKLVANIMSKALKEAGLLYPLIHLRGQSPQLSEEKAFFSDFFSHRMKNRSHMHFGLCLRHTLYFIQTKNFILKMLNEWVFHVFFFTSAGTIAAVVFN